MSTGMSIDSMGSSPDSAASSSQPVSSSSVSGVMDLVSRCLPFVPPSGARLDRRGGGSVRVIGRGYLSLRGLGDHSLEHALGTREAFDLLSHGGHVLQTDGGAGILDHRLGLADGVATEVALGDDLLDIGQELLDLNDELFWLMLDALELFVGAPLYGKLLRVLHHLDDLVLGEAARRCNLDRLLLPRFEIARADAHDTIGVDGEVHLDLDLALRRAAQAGENELSEEVVLLGLLALALHDDDFDRRLVVAAGGKRLGAARR